MNFNLYYSSLSELEKTYIYIKSMRMPMNRRALFADGTKITAVFRQLRRAMWCI